MFFLITLLTSFQEAHAGGSILSGGLPLQGSDLAARWDMLYNFLVWLSLFFTVLVLGAMSYFAIFHRKRPGHKSKYITGHVGLEVIWTAIPTVLLMGIFVWGYVIYNDMTRAPEGAYEIRVIGKQWSWQFQYPDGRTLSGEFYVPMNRPVKMIMTSSDVLHSFFIPNFRVKQDVVPEMYTSVWFEATVPGKHQVYCTEYCGVSHSGMLAQVIVLDDADWAAFERGKKLDSNKYPVAGAPLADAASAADSKNARLTAAEAPTRSLAEQGKMLAQSKGCVSCHSADGSPRVGPTYKGIYGKSTELADGTKVLVDDNYLRESIENPNAKIVKGFKPGMMPTFKGLLEESEMNALITYVKSLKE
jgi:cytochrome c oxidase subunit II